MEEEEESQLCVFRSSRIQEERKKRFNLFENNRPKKKRFAWPIRRIISRIRRREKKKVESAHLKPSVAQYIYLYQTNKIGFFFSEMN